MCPGLVSRMTWVCCLHRAHSGGNSDMYRNDCGLLNTTENLWSQENLEQGFESSAGGYERLP